MVVSVVMVRQRERERDNTGAFPTERSFKLRSFTLRRF
jgi:hypothetical protein